MEPDVVPADLAAALRGAGYRAGGPVGIGAHGPAWTAVGRPDSAVAGMRVVATVLAVGAPGSPVRARLDALRAVAHEHLAQVVDVVPFVAGSGAGPVERWAVLVAEVPGPSLAALLAARPPLAAGEVVTLVVPLAGALAVLHDAGLVHGDVSPANVVVRPDGRPVLIDHLGGLAPGGARDGGTPGFAAPEVARAGPPGPAGDVHALARVALAALAAEDGPALRLVLEQACAADPMLRPSAAELAARCYAAATAQPLDLPDAAVLARTMLARLATGAGPRSALTVRPGRSQHRAVGHRPRAVVRVLGAAAALAVCGVVVAAIVRAPSGGAPAPTGRPAATADRQLVGPSDPVDAAVALTKRRAVVLSAGDPAALVGVERVGGAAHAADLELLARVRAAGLRIEGLSAEVGSAKLVDAVAASSESAGADRPLASARVEITSGLTAYRRVTGDGAIRAEVPAQPARTVVLTLDWTPRGWRVATVADRPLSGPGA